VETGIKCISCSNKKKKAAIVLSLVKIQKLKRTLYVRKSIELFLESISEMIFHLMQLFKNG